MTVFISLIIVGNFRYILLFKGQLYKKINDINDFTMCTVADLLKDVPVPLYQIQNTECFWGNLLHCH